MKRKRLASVDIGHVGQPGDGGCTEEQVEIFAIHGDRYEAIGVYRTGCNQGYFQCNYSHGPWRGRGDTIDDAVSAMLNIVEQGYIGSMQRASQEAAYEAEDVLEEA